MQPALNPKPCPLTDEHCALLDKLLQLCAEDRAYHDKLESIGLDCSHLRAQLQAHEAFAANTKKAFFPDRA